MKKHLHFLLVSLTLAGVNSCTQPAGTGAPEMTNIKVSCKSGGEPNLHITASGQALLSWVEYLDDSTDALVFSKLENNQWTPPQTIASGNDWFVNWADFPSVTAYLDDEEALAVHWLQMSAPGTYDYDVHIAQSHDGGRTWGESFIPHTDGVAAEHGFVSILPLPGGRMFATWLDGRNTKESAAGSPQPAEGDDHAHGGGAMTLRCAVFDKTGQLSEEAELDHKVCDCCSTTAAWTPQGPIVAYRNRSDEENRDIFYTRKTEDGWTPPQAVFADNWHITGCPVNGPALATAGDTVALAWFTSAGGQPRVKVAFSADAGAQFGAPVVVDGGKPEGRVGVVFLTADKALVSWLATVEGGAEIRVVEVGTDGRKGEALTVAAVSPSRDSGFPQMVKYGDGVLFAWTVVEGDATHLASALWRP